MVSEDVAAVDAVSHEGFISTVAGTGAAGYNGDSSCGSRSRVAGSGAMVNQPSGLATDSAGNLYIADTQNHRVRKVGLDGSIWTVAGNGVAGFSVDGKYASGTSLNFPWGVVVDGAGNLYIADTHNHRVRRVDVNGMISTVAGTGVAGYGNDGLAAHTANLNFPCGLAVDDAGNLYIADTHNHRVRRVSVDDGVITTVAGNGAYGYSGDNVAGTSARLYYPIGVAVDGAGNLYIADQSNHRVRRVDGSGVITTVAGTGTAGYAGAGGPAASAQLYYPIDVAVDMDGNLYIADTSNHRVRKVNATDGVISTVAGSGSAGYQGDCVPANPSALNTPRGVAVDGAGNLYISDFGNARVRKVAGPVKSFSVSPGTPVTLDRDGSYRYPGVEVRNDGVDSIAPQRIIVSLPAGRGLAFDGNHRLTVWQTDQTMATYTGTPSVDGQTITFTHVDLGTPAFTDKAALWVEVNATSTAPTGPTSLDFNIGGKQSKSTTLNVV